MSEAPSQIAEQRRPIPPALDTIVEFGRTRHLLTCPFCLASVLAYLWSRAGSGKRCSCGAVLYMQEAMRREPVTPKKTGIRRPRG